MSAINRSVSDNLNNYVDYNRVTLSGSNLLLQALDLETLNVRPLSTGLQLQATDLEVILRQPFTTGLQLQKINVEVIYDIVSIVAEVGDTLYLADNLTTFFSLPIIVSVSDYIYNEFYPFPLEGAKAALGILNSSSDSFFQTDNINLLFNYRLFVLDDIANYVDAVQLLSGINIRIFDVYLLSDNLIPIYNYFLTRHDITVLYDYLNYSFSNLFGVSDTIQLQDNVAYRISNNFDILINDYMTFRDTDGVKKSLLYSDDYIRRYLNDRMFKMGDAFIVKSEKFNLKDGIYMELM